MTQVAEALSRADRLDAALELAAERVGDLTRPVMDRFYDRHPQARGVFEPHCKDDLAEMEGQMVGQALYCLMEVIPNPGVVQVMLSTELDHHASIDIPREYVLGLIDCAFDVVGEAAGEPGRTLIEELRGEVHALASAG